MTRDELAAKLFPRRWFAVACLPGERARRERHRLRKDAERAVILDELRLRGASCRNCRSYRTAGGGVSKPWCARESDFHGYVEVKSDDLCSYWRAA